MPLLTEGQQVQTIKDHRPGNAVARIMRTMALVPSDDEEQEVRRRAYDAISLEIASKFLNGRGIKSLAKEYDCTEHRILRALGQKEVEAVLHAAKIRLLEKAHAIVDKHLADCESDEPEAVKTRISYLKGTCIYQTRGSAESKLADSQNNLAAVIDMGIARSERMRQERNGTA